ncbi:hypothetical protein, partial [Klebsiella pneumoniae]|uniref:hypothetical protein n=1 Tax=Klebsiella pneumoniae TaxID=573 RepID=UPI001C83F47E
RNDTKPDANAENMCDYSVLFNALLSSKRLVAGSNPACCTRITPHDRDTRSTRASLAVAVIPFLTTALFTAGRHCDDFML